MSPTGTPSCPTSLFFNLENLSINKTLYKTSFMDIQELENLLKKGAAIEDILKEHAWQEFEAIVAQILAEHGFDIERNVRFTVGGKRFEVDIIAARFDELLCVDCKKW